MLLVCDKITNLRRLCIMYIFYVLKAQSIGGSRGGGARRAPPPTGPDSFILTCKIFEM